MFLSMPKAGGPKTNFLLLFTTGYTRRYLVRWISSYGLNILPLPELLLAGRLSGY